MNLYLRYIFILGFVSGVGIFSYFDLNWYHAAFLFVLFVGLSFIYLIRRGWVVLVVLVCIFGSLLGAARMFVYESGVSQNSLLQFEGTEVKLVGVIVSEPDERERSTRLTVRIDEVNKNNLVDSSKIILSANRFPKFLYGDKVLVKGVLQRPENFETDTGRTFDYVSYLEKDQIYHTILFPHVEFVSSNHGNLVKTKLFLLKNKWLQSIESVIPDPQASLLGGLVVGAKQSLGEELTEDFRKTGIIHIVVLSGYNVTIVAEAIMRLFVFLAPALSLSLGVVSIFFFAIMTGASATIVRASIMAVLVLLARATGRESVMTYALFLTAFFMVFHNPMIVLYDPSFQLSFMATFGLLQLSPIFEKRFHFIKDTWQVRQILSATLSTQIFVLPLLLYMMGEVSLVAPIVNILVLVMIPATMLFGFMTGIVALLNTVLALPFAYLTNILLSYELFVVDIFARLPFASVTVPTFPFWAMFVTYSLYGLLFFYYKKEKTLQSL